MKATLVLSCLITLGVDFDLQAQNPFQNLDFESAILPGRPPDPDAFDYGRVPIQLALPGWSAYVGTRPEVRILHDSAFLDSAGFGVIDSACTPSWWYFCKIPRGNFTAFLQSGNDLNAPSTHTDVSLAQTGLIPAGTRSLRFLASTPGGPAADPAASLHVLINGHEEPLYQLSTMPDFNGYGVDVSSLAGQEAELRFTVAFRGFVFLDAIQFSPTPVPEPGVGWLFAVGIGFVFWWRRIARRRLV